VRITRTTRGGARPPERVSVIGVNHNLLGEAGVVPVSMKIDKCSGAILEMSFDKDKLTMRGAKAPERPAPPPPAAAKPADKPAEKPADRRAERRAREQADRQNDGQDDRQAARSSEDRSQEDRSHEDRSHEDRPARRSSGSPSPDDMADVLIRMFGRDAESQARENAASNARAGDSEGQKLWLAVADIISDRVYGRGRGGP
jgi:hypothetical protein